MALDIHDRGVLARDFALLGAKDPRIRETALLTSIEWRDSLSIKQQSWLTALAQRAGIAPRALWNGMKNAPPVANRRGVAAFE
jgi:hypothetical protein